MAKKGEVVYVVVDDEGKLFRVFADRREAEKLRRAVDGEILVRLIE